MVWDYLVLAFRSIKHKSTRSYLTIVGILIGVAAIVALVSMTQGLSESVAAEFEAAGTDTISVMSGAGMQGMMGGGTLDQDLVSDVESVRGVRTVEYFLMDMVEVEFRGETATTFVWGSSPGLLDEIPQFDIVEGRPLREMDSGNAVIGDTVYPEVFDSVVNMRDNLVIKEENYRVVGRLDRIGSPSDDQSVVITLDDAQDLFGKEDEISMMYVLVESGFDVSEVAQDIEDTLSDELDDDEFAVETMEQLLEAVNNILAMVQALFVGVASIALLVGGVGIMNTMYTSVLEKTREIGIMKSVGARKSNVLTVFMFESGLLGLAGGVLGVTLGLSIAKGVEYVVQQYFALDMLRVSLSPVLIIGALTFSFLLGTISGILPAKRAANMNPVDALRDE